MKLVPCIVALCSSAFIFSPRNALAADWPMYRGNAALTGVANELLPKKPALLWSFKTGGPVRSSPVIAGGKVFIGSDDFKIYALDFASGKKLWEFKTGAAVHAP